MVYFGPSEAMAQNIPQVYTTYIFVRAFRAVGSPAGVLLRLLRLLRADYIYLYTHTHVVCIFICEVHHLKHSVCARLVIARARVRARAWACTCLDWAGLGWAAG